MAEPAAILEDALRRASACLDDPLISEPNSLARIVAVVRCLNNRAGARMLLTCALAKIHRPEVDIRKPYTEIGGDDTFSGRAEYDEAYIGSFAAQFELPVNATTAFLTPGFRTINVPLSLDITISGRPKQMYVDTILLLDDVYHNRLTADELLCETIRQLLLLKQEQDSRMQQLLRELKSSENGIPLSSEEIIGLIEQHLKSPKSSRLPVLIVAAAYQAASSYLNEYARPLQSHTAADTQTGAIGDIEITLVDEDKVVTCYEMKAKEVTKADIDLAIQKIAKREVNIDNYLFITTDKIRTEIIEYATSRYRETGGVEFAVLDCINFLRHFLHLFHRVRGQFLDEYQSLVLNEPDSAVSQPLKEVFLTLRRAVEMDSSS